MYTPLPVVFWQMGPNGAKSVEMGQMVVMDNDSIYSVCLLAGLFVRLVMWGH